MDTVKYPDGEISIYCQIDDLTVYSKPYRSKISLWASAEYLGYKLITLREGFR